MTHRPYLTALALLGALATAACSGAGASEKGPAAVSSAASAVATPEHVQAADGTLYPGESWPTGDAAKLGFDPRAVRRIARDAKAQGTTCLLVARQGRVVGEWNWKQVASDTP